MDVGRTASPFQVLWDYTARSLAQNAYLLPGSYMSRLTPCIAGREDEAALAAAHQEALKVYNQAAQAETAQYFQRLNAASEGGGFFPDADQLKMVAVNENCCLVIAGAGTGKSSTLAAAVRHLLDQGEQAPESPALTEAKADLLRRMGALGPDMGALPPSVPVKPEEILVLSYSNKAVKDLRDKFAESPFHIPVGGKNGVVVSTFHSQGNSILVKAGQMVSNVNNGELRPENGTKEDRQGLPQDVLNFFKKTYMKDLLWTDRLLLFFAQSFGSPDVSQDVTLWDYFLEQSKRELETMISPKELARQNRRRWRTIRGEMVRSFQEAVIADFLYECNIDYEYEPLYLDPQGQPRTIGNSKKYYTPDFRLVRAEDGKAFYYEHFGFIPETPGPEETPEQMRYRAESREKLDFMNHRGQELLHTYGWYKEGSLISRLTKLVRNYGFTLQDRTEEELVQQLAERRAEARMKRFTDLLWDFISAFDSRGFPADQYDRWLQPVGAEGAVKNERSRLFLEICRECHARYRTYLADSSKTDFAKMISGATAILNSARAGTGPAPALRYKYIFVDEYQDISKGRSEFLNALRKYCGARLMAIGDDWQSIYAFSGSDVSLFTGFLYEMGEKNRQDLEDLDRLTLEVTYRNPQSLIDLAGKFVMKNDRQIRKNLRSRHPKKITDPVAVYLYEEGDEQQELARLKEAQAETDEEANASFLLRETAKEAAQEKTNAHIRSALTSILDRIWREQQNAESPKKQKEILFLGRYRADAGMFLEASELFVPCSGGANDEGEQWTLMGNEAFQQAFRCTFRTVHGAKGAQADYVILLNGQDDPRYGFPSKRENDALLTLVLPQEEGQDPYPFAEERRLFYVALTRTKERVWCLAPLRHPSEFLVELKDLSREMEEQADVSLMTMAEDGTWAEEDDAFHRREEARPPYPPRCPWCGRPLQRIDQLQKGQRWGPLKKRLYWKRGEKCRQDESLSHLFICTGDQTQCGFMTNDPAGGTLSIQKCGCAQEADCQKSDRYYRVQHVNKYFLAAPCEHASLDRRDTYASETLPACLRAPKTEEESVCMAEEDLVLRAVMRLSSLLSFTFGEEKFLQMFRDETTTGFTEFQQSSVQQLRQEFPELTGMAERLEPALTRTLEKGLLCSSLGLRLTHAGVMACRAMTVLRAVQQLEREVCPYGKKRFLWFYCKNLFEGLSEDRANALRKAVEEFPERSELQALGEWSVDALIDQMNARGLLQIRAGLYRVLKSAVHAPVWPPQALFAGAQVSHPQYGNGTITSRRSEEGFVYYSIDFETAGPKVLKY